MAQLTYRQAIAAGIAQEMRRDPMVVVIGEDVAIAGGVFRATAGLLEEFGPTRVRDTPISEQAIVGVFLDRCRHDRLASGRQRHHAFQLPTRLLGHGLQTRWRSFATRPTDR